MLRNHVKIAFRNLYKYRSYSLINIVGLSVALAVSLLMLLWVQDEWSMDKFHQAGDRIYRVKRTIPLEDNILDVYRGIPYPVVNAAQEELPEVEKYIPIGFSFEENLQREAQVFRAQGTFANTSLFEVLSFPILKGDVRQLDEKLNSMVISESLANKFFGHTWESTTIGSVISIGDKGDFSVEAVFADLPDNSTLKGDFFFSFKHHLSDNDWMLDWGNSGMQGAVLLAEGSDPDAVAQKIEALFKDHQEKGNKEGILLQKYADDYLYGSFDDQAKVDGGRIEYVRTFGIAALLLLFISCINFVNLATARASKRAKEVGVRKTVGAGQGALIGQFMTEAAVVTIISVGVAYLLAEALLPTVRTMTEKMLDFNYGQPIFWMSIIGIIVLTTLLSGAYPAFVLSSFRPINALKNKAKQQAGSVSLRKILVVLQFVLSLLLIVGSFVVTQQIDYIKNKNLGISKDNLLNIGKESEIADKYDALKNELLAQEGIANVTLAGPNPLDVGSSTNGVQWPGKRPDQDNIDFKMIWTSSNFDDFFDVELIAGTYYQGDRTEDTTALVLNERAVEIMGLEDPVGQTITFWDEPRKVIGVIKDFHNQPLYQRIQPMCFLLNQDNAGGMYVKAEDGKMTAAIAGLQSSFAKVLPDFPLHFNFVDEEYQKNYKSESLTGQLANYFALISILISCLGLLGLATFMAEQKTKEIGIRKVLGATTVGIISLLSKDFIKLVVIALVISIPIAYYFMNIWLTNFEYRIDIQWWVFALSGLIAVIVAVLTVGVQSMRAAVVNPTESLRGE